ncbi:MAG: M48 family metallopeptidase [Sphingobacteriaceae bacterium]
MKKLPIYFAGLFTILMISCSQVPLTGRSQLSLVNDSELQQAATLSYKEFLKDPKTKVIANSADARRVKAVGSKIASAIGQYMRKNGYGDEYNYQWEFNLIESKEINAWCMPGGKVAVFTGILPIMLNDAGLATVLGHEISHAIAHHSAERASQMAAAQGIGALLGAATGGSSESTQQIVGQLYGVGAQGLYLLPNSRKQESEADRLGLTFMAIAGYNPQSAVSFWQRMSKAKEGGAPPEFLSTHPSDERRIADIQKLIPEAMKYYNGKK